MIPHTNFTGVRQDDPSVRACSRGDPERLERVTGIRLRDETECVGRKRPPNCDFPAVGNQARSPHTR